MNPPISRSLPLTLVEVVLSGHLTAKALDEALRPVCVSSLAHLRSIALLFDCRAMTGYDTDARQRFVDWNHDCLLHVPRVAVVTTNPLWHLVVSAMALAAGKYMLPFSDKAAAINWLTATPRAK